MNVNPLELFNTATKEPFTKESVMMADNNIILCLAYSVRHCGEVGHLHKINAYIFLYRIRFHLIQIKTQLLLGTIGLRKILRGKLHKIVKSFSCQKRRYHGYMNFSFFITLVHVAEQLSLMET